jgi:uncharacterized protein involved in exopolysaccharide biosynthesis
MSRNFELIQQVSDRPIKVSRAGISQPPTTARVAIEAFFRQWKLFMVACVGVLLATLLVTLLTRKEYISEMKFLVQNGRENVVVTPERTSPTSIVSGVTEAQVNSELDILHSHDVIDQVADPGWASLPKTEQTTDAARRHEKRVTAFERQFGTEIVRRTNIISVSVLADTPDKAREYLYGLAAAYLAKHRELQRPAGASEFFASEAERARKAWDDGTERLIAFQQEHQLLSLSDREIAIDEQISEDQGDLFTNDSTLKELDVQIAEGSHRMREMPSREVTQQRSSPNQSSVEQLQTLVVNLENKRTALLTNYKENDRYVRELDQQLATVKAALDEAKTSPTREETSDVDPAWQQVHTNYVQNQITRQALTARQAVLQVRVNNLKQELAGLQALSVQFNNLQSQADELKDNYQLYAQKRDQTQIEDAMDEHKLLNVAIAQEPTVSYTPMRPKPITNAVLGTVTAFFLGICVVYFAEVGRNTVATPRELEAVSQYPVLATVPRVEALNFPVTRTVLTV